MIQWKGDQAELVLQVESHMSFFNREVCLYYYDPVRRKLYLSAFYHQGQTNLSPTSQSQPHSTKSTQSWQPNRYTTSPSLFARSRNFALNGCTLIACGTYYQTGIAV